MLKKLMICSLSLMFAFSGIGAIHAVDSETSTPEEIELQTGENDFLTDLADDGYAELGKYKVEKIKDNIYHWDEGTKALPGGATDENGNMNNPSSMYFVIDEQGVILVDLGNGASEGSEDEANAKEIVEAMVGDKPLTILVTHNHGDHTGFGRSTAVFENITVDKVYISTLDYTDVAKEPLAQFENKIETVDDGDTVEIYGKNYDFYVVGAHTEGSLMIKDESHKALYTGDTFGSGFIWALWPTNNGNPIAALSDGVARARAIMNATSGLSILAGHRWQQFDESNAQRPGEMTIQYFNDMAQVITGLSDATTVRAPYDVVAWASDAIELSSNGAKAKIDTLPEFVDTYLESTTKMDDAYIYSASTLLSIESVNATAAATFVIFPDSPMTDEEAQTYLQESGIKAIVDRSASTAYVARSNSVDSYKAIMNRVGVTSNLKLIGIGDGATFINQNLTGYMNSVAGLALINPEAGSEVKVSVPTYLVTDNQSIIDTYVKANNAVAVSDGYFENPESHYEIVVVNNDTSISATKATSDAWDQVLCKFGRIGNHSDVYKDIATWYSRPIISGIDQDDQSRKYQYTDSIDAINNIDRVVVTQDLDNDGILSLWYEYIPEQVKDAADGSIPVVVLFHGNTNDPRTQYDTSGWAQVASQEGIILICPEWQGHTYQQYTYDPMTDNANETPDSDVIKMIDIITEKYPQIDKSRIYASGLSAGSRNTSNICLSNPDIFAAGAGHSGPFGASDTNNQMAANYKDQYDMPIIFFTGDGDEYCRDAFDTNESNAGFTTAQAFMELNNMEVPQAVDPNNSDLYGITWNQTTIIEPTAENIAKMKLGVITNDNNVEIAMARIYGWGHWNYTPDAKMMWEFMSKYARDLTTGASIRLDLQQDENQKPVTGDDSQTTTPVNPSDSNKPATSVATGDTTNIAPYMLTIALSAGALVALKAIKKRKQTH